MAIIDIDRMYWEILSTINNSTGSTNERYEKAKKQFLKSVEETIEANKSDLIKEYNQNK